MYTLTKKLLEKVICSPSFVTDGHIIVSKHKIKNAGIFKNAETARKALRFKKDPKESAVHVDVSDKKIENAIGRSKNPVIFHRTKVTINGETKLRIFQNGKSMRTIDDKFVEAFGIEILYGNPKKPLGCLWNDDTGIAVMPVLFYDEDTSEETAKILRTTADILHPKDEEIEKKGEPKEEQEEKPKPECTFGTYKGNEFISLPLDENGKYKLNFGRKKAQAILQYVNEIAEFAQGE